MPDAKDVVQDRLRREGPQPGTRYRHYKGGEYEVLCCAVKEDTLEPLVVYRSLTHGTVWARTLGNWTEEVEHEGRRVKRFTSLLSVLHPAPFRGRLVGRGGRI